MINQRIYTHDAKNSILTVVEAATIFVALVSLTINLIRRYLIKY